MDGDQIAGTEDYILCPLEGRFSFDKVVKQNGRVVFIPEAK